MTEDRETVDVHAVIGIAQWGVRHVTSPIKRMTKQAKVNISTGTYETPLLPYREYSMKEHFFAVISRNSIPVTEPRCQVAGKHFMPLPLEDSFDESANRGHSSNHSSQIPVEKHSGKTSATLKTCDPVQPLHFNEPGHGGSLS